MQLFDPNVCDLLPMLKLQSMDLLTEIGNSLTLIELSKGQTLPTLKSGMWILLKGKVEVKTHWKVEEGQNKM